MAMKLGLLEEVKATQHDFEWHQPTQEIIDAFLNHIGKITSLVFGKNDDFQQLVKLVF